MSTTLQRHAAAAVLALSGLGAGAYPGSAVAGEGVAQPAYPGPIGSSSHITAIQPAQSRAAVETALRHRLDRAYLSYQWVRCVSMKRVYRGRQIWRCNVNFGDPHIVQYCAILDGRRLITDRENRALDCSPPRRGSSKDSSMAGT